MKTTYDYIIIGGGTAGCVLANRLSANGRHDVLLLEAGGEPSSPWIPIPAGFSKLLVDTKFNWKFVSEPEAGTDGRAIAIPRGKGLGGSSLINGMIYVRGQPGDFDKWAQSGASGWSFAELVPYFRKVEAFDGPAGETRGGDGALGITEVGLRPPLADAFIAAAQQAGYGLNRDYNDGHQEGFGYYQATQRRGRRVSAKSAYLDPARGRRNLAIVTDAHVLKIDVEGRRAVGATFRRHGQTVSVRAGREVILCAGGVQTPHILELSGIGHPGLLKPLGIEVVQALPGVGENYQDHFCTRMNWRVNRPITLNEQSRGLPLARSVLQYFASGRGILSLGTGLAFGFVKTRPGLEDADVQLYFMHASYADASKRILDRAPGMTIGVSQLRPESVGSIHARSADPLVPPAIRPNFLASQVDRDTMRRGMEIARHIVEQPALQSFVAHEMSPGPACRTEGEWDAFSRSNGQTIYHVSGTAKMGTDPAAVVDPTLRVIGLAGLRVADASIMPAIVSGNTQAAVYVIAEKASDLILRDAETNTAGEAGGARGNRAA
ncbi:GMC family oxidoreductase [Ancylobacter sp.]|uniref:GMC family oxidoreductase n=1 Tax=Ancylobacter sp. TaxID=1872567 RepID=UPI003BAAAC27